MGIINKVNEVETQRREIINKFVEKCKKILKNNLVSVILFGSTAKRLETKRSDLDFLIIVKRKGKKDVLKKIRMDFILDYGVKMDTILMSKKEVTNNFKYFSPLFVSFALGINILYDDGFFEREYHQFVDKLKLKKIKYYERGKLWNLQKINLENLQ